MQQNAKPKIDRVEGDQIILHDFYPKKPKDLKTVKIITPHTTRTYSIKKTRKGNYLMQ